MPQKISDTKFFQNCVARALFDNIAESPDELPFKKGDLLTVLEQNTAGLEGWWLCSLRGRQGICPENRLRLLPGVYDLGNKPTNDDSNFMQESISRNWLPNNNINASLKTRDEYYFSAGKENNHRYDVPISGPPIAVIRNTPYHHFLNSYCIKQFEENGSREYNVPKDVSNLNNSHADLSKNSYDIPEWPPIRVKNSSRNNDLSKSMNSSITISPSSSFSSLATSASDSVSSSNRSSIIRDYDVPKFRPESLLHSHTLKLFENQPLENLDSFSKKNLCDNQQAVFPASPDTNYINLETHGTLKPQYSEIRNRSSTEFQKQKSLSSISKEVEIGDGNFVKDLTQKDKKVLSFYGAQYSDHFLQLTQAIDAFLNTVEHNQPPKIFLSHGKFVILKAFQLVHIGDIIHQNITCSKINDKVLQLSNALLECLTSSVNIIKKAAMQFPSITAVQEMVDSIVRISHVARDLRMNFFVISQINLKVM